MKKVTVVLLALFTLVGVSEAQEFVLGVDLGIVEPTGDLGDVFDTGYHGKVFGEYFVQGALAVRFDLQYVELSEDNSFSGYYGDFKYQSYDALGSLAIHVGDIFSPHLFLMGGAGIYNWEVNYDWDYYTNGYSMDDSETDLGLHAGGGFRLPLGGIGFNFEALAHYIFYDDESEVMITAGMGLVFGM